MTNETVAGAPRRHRTLTLLACAVLALQASVVGGWSLAYPARFASDFPGLGLSWIPVQEPYSEHMVRDVGALHLALLVVTLAASLGRIPARIAGLAWLAFSVPHLLFHATHTAGLSSIERGTSLSALAVAVLASVVLTVSATTSGQSGR